MARRHGTEPEAAGADSFLDVITNIVGILIILVMVVGERAKFSPVPTKPEQSGVELGAARDEALLIEQDVHELQTTILRVNQEVQLRAHERSQIQTLVSAVERELSEKQQTLGEKANAQYLINRDLAVAKDALARMKAELDLTDQTPAAQTVEIKSYPTPLGVKVEGRQVFLQLRHGRVSVVPIDLLMARFKNMMRNKMSGLGSPEMKGTIGPFEGYYLHYELGRSIGPQGPSLDLMHADFVPVNEQVGEPVDAALREGSEFRIALSQMSSDLYTMTLWTSADSFSEYSKVKQELTELGFSVAGWPLEDGQPISGSPNGRAATKQ